MNLIRTCKWIKLKLLIVFQYRTHEQVRRQLRVGVPIEEHAKEVYTRAMYERFYDELFDSGKYTIHRKDNNFKYILIQNNDINLLGAKTIEVNYISDEEITCECGLYEHMRILCRHSIKVTIVQIGIELSSEDYHTNEHV